VFRVGVRVGKGSQSEVFAVTTIDGRVAPLVLKCCRVEKLAQWEARLYTIVGRHENVVRFLRILPGGGLVLERARSTLSHELSNRPSFSTQAQVQILAGAARGLAHLHSKGVIHRDIATRNLLIAEDDRVLLSDLGLAVDLPPGYDHVVNKDIAERLRGRGLAPESASSAVFTCASDVYAFGNVICDVLCRHAPPEAAESLKQVRGGMAPCQQLPSAFMGKDRDLYSLMCWCLTKDPNGRPTAHLLANLLGLLAQQRVCS
jgi:serine/threonine protein kinase